MPRPAPGGRCQAAIRALPDQRRQRSAGFVDLLLRGLQLLLRSRHARLRLTHLQLAVDAGAAALPGQFQQLLRAA